MRMNLAFFTKHCRQSLCIFEGKRCAGGKLSKVRLTGMAASNAIGEKLPMFVIGKYA